MVQVNPLQQSVMAYGIVPIAAIEHEYLRDCTGPEADFGE